MLFYEKRNERSHKQWNTRKKEENEIQAKGTTNDDIDNNEE